jgi:hypothetical protein
MEKDITRFDIRGLVLVLVAMIGGVFFCAGTLANDDPLWFLPFFNETPTRIVIYQPGCKVALTNGHPRFDEFNRVLNQSLSQIDGYDAFGLSPASLKEYRETEWAVEVFYPHRVKIHSTYRFGHPDSVLIPLSGMFGETRSIFGGYGGDYWSGALRLKSNAEIRRAAEAMRCRL